MTRTLPCMYMAAYIFTAAEGNRMDDKMKRKEEKVFLCQLDPEIIADKEKVS